MEEFWNIWKIGRWTTFGLLSLFSTVQIKLTQDIKSTTEIKNHSP